MRHVRQYCPEINFFTQPEFIEFKRTLDGEMRRLKATGAGITKKRAQPISSEEEEKLWIDGSLGSTSPQTLLDTIIFMCGMYFALRSGQEHRTLQHDQIELKSSEDGKLCLVYTENTSKNNPGGIKNQKLKPKVVTHYQNQENPSCCFVEMYRTYISHCPPESDRKTN